MKRAKIMLTAIAVLAIVGGALAFKANTKFANSYCILTTAQTPAKCTSEIINSKFFEVLPVAPVVTYYYITKNLGDVCTQKDCLVSTSFKRNN